MIQKLKKIKEILDQVNISNNKIKKDIDKLNNEVDILSNKIKNQNKKKCNN